MQPATLPQIVCEACQYGLREHVDSYGSSFGDIDPPPEAQQCELCGKEIDDTFYSFTAVRLTEKLGDDISKDIYGCDNGPCRDDLNSDLLEVFRHVVDGLDEKIHYHRLLRKLSWDGLLDLVTLSGVKCGVCGYHPDNWNQEIKAESFYLIIPSIPGLPAEVTEIPISASDPADLIEYYRSDCSDSLIHMTKPGDVEWIQNNIDDRKEKKKMSAQEILYIILASKQLKAFKGIGIRKPAVCFTEKPLNALKDTLLGQEAQIRRNRNAIIWQPYGLMFKKEYIRKFGTEPVLPMSPVDERLLPEQLRHRIVSFSTSSNWNHEREWRCGKDIDFDPSQAVVLVPRFEQIAPFQAALARNGISVKGFLPLLDLFACV